MEWLLILTFTLHGQTESLHTGLMVDERACIIAGAGMVLVLEAANPGLTVAYACAPEVKA
jgi:hypothetical protein